MKIQTLSIALVLSGLFALKAPAQSWVPIGRGPNGASQVSCLYGDTILDRLIAGGTFSYMMNDVDTVLCIGQAAWNGERWDSLGHRISPWTCGNWSCLSPQTFWYFRYQGDLYATGDFGFPVTDSLWNWNIARLNEDSMRWEALECVNSDLGILTLGPKSFQQDTLYGTGYVTNICGYPNSAVYAYDGSGFTPFAPFDALNVPSGDYVGYVFKYQGQFYMTGLFTDTNVGQTYCIARFNGTSWETVPGWNSVNPIKDVLIHDGKLYVCGYFLESQGAPGNHIAMFDGTQWSDMGGGLIEQVGSTYGVAYQMQVWNNELYVIGQFEYAGGIPANNIAKWNGVQWCSLGGEFSNPDGPLLSAAVWHDSLYVAGGFTQIDGQPIKMVAKWMGSVVECSPPIGIEEQEAASFFIAPNPTNDWLHLLGTSSLVVEGTLTIADALGRVVVTARLSGERTVDVSRLNSGLYVATLAEPGGIGLSRRFVKN